MNDYCENCGIEGKRADITLFRGEAKVYDIYLCIDCKDWYQGAPQRNTIVRGIVDSFKERCLK